MAIFCESKNLYLREIELKDSTLISIWKKDMLIRKMSVGLNTKVTQQNQESDIQRSLETNQPYYIIALKNDDRSIGYIRINWMDDTNRFAWLRFGLGEERGKGYSKEALICLLMKLFASGTSRIDAEVFEFNDVSYFLLQSLGFIHEGTRRMAYYSDGNVYDIYTLGLLKSDFDNKLIK
ncbi:GNAT family N-acetyltransferase [Bacillus sp. 2205SS5-2]|uniref:GNAT family N-acetyltransferase n=1 Tax=Bacillus sp. 2205SS5-2 TaxID=3109031 RepID=UPI0030042934